MKFLAILLLCCLIHGAKPDAHASVYDEFVQICNQGSAPQSINKLMALVENKTALSPEEFVDVTACLALYFNSIENKKLANKYHGLYFQQSNREHDAAFAGTNYQVSCSACQGTGIRKEDCPSCNGGTYTTKTTGSVRTCPGCRGDGFFPRTCMVCAGNKMIFSKQKAESSFLEYLKTTLMLRAENDAPKFTARLGKTHREDFIKLYLTEKLKPVSIYGSIFQVIDENTILVSVAGTEETVCVRQKGHGYLDHQTFQGTVFPVEPFSYTAVLGNNRTVAGYTTELFEGAVFAMGQDALLDLFQARDADDPSLPETPAREGGSPDHGPNEAQEPLLDRAHIDNLLLLKTMASTHLAAGANETGHKHGNETVTRIGREDLEVFEKFKGKDLVIPIQPVSSGEPGVLDFSKFTKGTKGVLRFSLTGRDAQASGKASITRSTTVIWSKIPGKEWHDVEVPFDHEDILVRVQTVKWANDWVYVTYTFSPAQ